MKYKFLIIIVSLIFVNQNILSQNNFAFGINLIPAITYSYSPSDLPSPKNNFGYSFGITGIYFIQPNLIIETGLNIRLKNFYMRKIYWIQEKLG